MPTARKIENHFCDLIQEKHSGATIGGLYAKKLLQVTLKCWHTLLCHIDYPCLRSGGIAKRGLRSPDFSLSPGCVSLSNAGQAKDAFQSTVAELRSLSNSGTNTISLLRSIGQCQSQSMNHHSCQVRLLGSHARSDCVGTCGQPSLSPQLENETLLVRCMQMPTAQIRITFVIRCRRIVTAILLAASTPRNSCVIPGDVYKLAHLAVSL